MQNRRFYLERGEAGFGLASEVVVAPRPGPGEVLVRMRAVALNRRDFSIRDTTYPVPPDADRFTPLSDGAGEVAAVGEGVTTVKVGDRVASTFFQTWPDGRVSMTALMSALGAGGLGVFADHAILKETGVVPLPDTWSFEEGASLSCAAVTAWSALVRLGRMQAGDKVLVIGTGGVALFALQIAAASGAIVVVVSSSDDKIARAKALGAAHGVNYGQHPEWETQVQDMAGGVDHLLELGGGTLTRSLASMALGGHVALIGGLAGPAGDIPMRGLRMKSLRVSSVTVGSRADHLAVQDFMVRRDLRPVIDSVFHAAAAEDAYRRLDAGAFGKVVIRL
jgi:NADPH:quinone reductase-like Zn-dependent oxidoreductase